MLDNSVRIINFDNSVSLQQEIIQKYNSRIIDLTGVASQSRLFMNQRTRLKIEESLSGAPSNTVTFLGSGDFHHISELLISQLDQPMALLVFDFHPDWDILPPRLACGAWVSRVLRNKNILKCVLMGMGSEDLSAGGLQTANLYTLSNNRLEIYPYQHKPSRAYFRRIPQNFSIKTKKGLFSTQISWQELKGQQLDKFALELIKRLPSKKVYISIDKDCLSKEFAITNWEEGFLTLGQLLLMLKVFKDNLDIIGLDITGDYSPISIKGKIKSWISRLDHPAKNSASTISSESSNTLNEKTNLKILETIFS